MQTSTVDRRSAYEILTRIGTGTYSTVYKAIRQSDGTIVAIKIIDISLLDRTGIDNVLNEIRILSSVSNPYIVEYHEAFIDPSESFVWIVMEHLGGGDLANVIKSKHNEGARIQERQIWTYMVHILRGICELHKLKILHRDIKPANVFLTDDFKHAKIGDLNVSKVLKQDLTRTQIGTPYYLAPEIWDRKAYDYRADIFSLGVLLYELAALRHPHQAITSQELHHKLMKDKIERIPLLYSEDLNIIIMKCLIKEQTLRPTAEQLLNSRIIKQKILELELNKKECYNSDLNCLADTITLPNKLSLLNKKLPQRSTSRTISYRDGKSDVNNLTNELTKDSINTHRTAKVVVRDIAKMNLPNTKRNEPIIINKKKSQDVFIGVPTNNTKNRVGSKNAVGSRNNSAKRPLICDKGNVRVSGDKLKVKADISEMTRKGSLGSLPSKKSILPPKNAKSKPHPDPCVTKLTILQSTGPKPLVSDRTNPPMKMPKNFSGVFIKKITENKVEKSEIRRSSNTSMYKGDAPSVTGGRYQSPKVDKYADYLKKVVDAKISPKRMVKASGGRRNNITNRSCP